MVNRLASFFLVSLVPLAAHGSTCMEALPLDSSYIDHAICFETENVQPIGQRITAPGGVRLLHAALGVVTESAELADALKKHFYYGKALDRTNLIEEMGDVFWYLAIMAKELGVSFEEIQQANLAKLTARYGERFTEKKAVERNLEKEYEALKKVP